MLFAVHYKPEPSADQQQALIDFKESPSVLHHLYAWNYYTCLDFLKSHTYVIELLTQHIKTGQWPQNDSANQQTLVTLENVGGGERQRPVLISRTGH